MRKALIFLIGFVLLGTLGMVYAQTPEENLEKAGKAELVHREGILILEKAHIEKSFFSMADDAVVSGEKEMKGLRKMVEYFDKTKSRFDKELEFYKVSTSVEILPVIREHLKIYFVWNEEEDKSAGTPYFRDNNKQEMRKFWVERTGYDVKVEKSRDNKAIALLGLVLGLIMGLLAFCITGWIKGLWRKASVVGFSVFAVVFAFMWTLF